VAPANLRPSADALSIKVSSSTRATEVLFRHHFDMDNRFQSAHDRVCSALHPVTMSRSFRQYGTTHLV